MQILETERLTLEEANMEDAGFFYTLLNTPTWLKYIGDRGIRSVADAEHYIQNSLIKSYRENGYGLYKMVLKSEGTPIGLCGLVNRETLSDPDIGFALLPKYEGKGYAYEAAFATLEFAKKQLQISTILAITSEQNAHSIRLIEKIGLVFYKKIRMKEGSEECLLYSN